MNSKEEAMGFSLALEIRAVEIVDVNSWADRYILEKDSPEIEIIDIAGCRDRNTIISNLNTFSVGANRKLALKRFFSLALSAIEKNMLSTSAVARKLFFLATSESAMGSYPEAFSFWDGIDLAKDGVYGDLEEQEKHLIEFLSREKT